jgi:hypothetical protein
LRRCNVSKAHALTLSKANLIVPATGYDAKVVSGDYDGQVSVTHAFPRDPGTWVESDLRAWAVHRLKARIRQAEVRTAVGPADALSGPAA